MLGRPWSASLRSRRPSRLCCSPPLTPAPCFPTSAQGGCIIRAAFLDRIRVAYERNPQLASLLVDPDFSAELGAAEASWRRVSALAITHGVPLPAMTGSLGYFDTYRR